MTKLMKTALFLLMPIVLSGCLTDDETPPDPNGPEEEKNRTSFEVGRRAECTGDVRTAEEKYRQLVGKGSFYGDYGLAMLLLRREPGSREAVELLLSCAKRASNATEKFPLREYESAFSAAAMVELAKIAELEHGRPDIAESLQSAILGVITPEDRELIEKKKVSADFKRNYEGLVSAVEYSRQNHGYPKPVNWPKISEMFKKVGQHVPSVGGEPGHPPGRAYKVVKFDKVQGATCQYDFEVRLAANGTFDVTDEVKSALRRQLVKEFLAANGPDSVNDVRTSFASWRQQESTIIGSVVAFKMSVARGEYDEATGRGKIIVRLDGRDMKAARKWVRENIAELVADKNVTLVAGKPPPPGAHYKIGSERMTEDGLLEVEFNTRE